MATFFQNLKSFCLGLRFRLSLAYALLLGLILSLFSYFIVDQYIKIETQEFDQFLRGFAVDISRFVDKKNDEVLFEQMVNQEIKYFPFRIKNMAIKIRQLDGKIVYESSAMSLPFSSQEKDAIKFTHSFSNFLTEEETNMRLVSLRIDAGKKQFILQVASSVEILTASQKRLINLLFIFIPFTVLAIFVTSVFLVGKVLRPVRKTVNVMKNLLETETYETLPEPNTLDEISDLIKTYNIMLSKLQRTLEAQGQFVANASHQLNTPLAIINGELDVLLSKERSSSEIQQFHQSLKQELKRLRHLVSDMLLISRVESGQANFILSSVRFDEVLTETVARLSVYAKEKNIMIKFELDEELLSEEIEFLIDGERQLLTCLCENIIENAIKYSKEFSSIKVELKRCDKTTQLNVINTGHIISQEIISKVNNSERFVRDQYGLSTQGTGLGLYLVKKIAEYHEAELKIFGSESQNETQIQVNFKLKA
jgi:signal transduction histidine kinase